MSTKILKLFDLASKFSDNVQGVLTGNRKLIEETQQNYESIKQELDGALEALFLAQAELEKNIKALKVSEGGLDKAKKSLEKSSQDLKLKESAQEKTQADLDKRTGSLKNVEEELSKVKKALEKANEDLKLNEVSRAELDNQLQALKNRFSEVEKEKNKAIADKNFVETKLTKVQENSDKLSKEAKTLETDKIQTQSLLKEANDSKQSLLADRNKAIDDKNAILKKVEESKLENDDMLKHLHFIQEELEKLYFSNQALKSENELLSGRWSRVKRRIANYIDFDSLEIVFYDAASSTQEIIFKIKNYSSGEIYFPQFYFQMLIKDGQYGLSICDQEGQSSEGVLWPYALAKEPEQIQIFKQMKATAWGQLLAALNVLEIHFADRWQGVDLESGLDTDIYDSTFKRAIADLRSLPSLLRYDSVRLKRELQNPDYEHLWLEIYGLGFRGRNTPKFEVRLGASEIETMGFSRLPKFEFPLIDGEAKPFESWYAETRDDFGPKFELRFALERKVFDFKTWSKLSNEDREFTYQLVLSMEQILSELQAEKISINRSWTEWISLMNEAREVMKLAASAQAAGTVQQARAQAQAPIQGQATPSKSLTQSQIETQSQASTSIPKGTSSSPTIKEVVIKPTAAKTVKKVLPTKKKTAKG